MNEIIILTNTLQLKSVDLVAAMTINVAEVYESNLLRKIF